MRQFHAHPVYALLRGGSIGAVVFAAEWWQSTLPLDTLAAVRHHLGAQHRMRRHNRAPSLLQARRVERVHVEL
jgi:hypothetical protein